jgi:flagellum-specific peptidoglycan hydrolase FlgJ
MPSLLPDKLTPIAPLDLYACLRESWRTLIKDAAPSRASLLVLMAHWALETGWGHFCHWYNLGNKKHVSIDGRDWTMFRCNEIIGGKVVWYDPPNPACAFVAYPDRQSGADDYLTMLRGEFRAAWVAVVSGDPSLFCHLLKLSGYYTADESLYTHGVVACYQKLDSEMPDDTTIQSPDPAA